MLALENIKYSKNSNDIIKGVSMKFERGGVYGIIGNNGVGKSTIGYIIMGLAEYKPTSGRIILSGEDISNLDITGRAKKGISLLWQEPVRFDGLSVKDYLTLNRKIDAKEIEEALDLVNLEPKLYLNRLVDKKLSGGERKKVELASCILLKPKYIVLDEPDSGIDIMSLDMIVKIIHYFQKNNTGVILITHRKEIARQCEYAYLLCNGRIFLEGKNDKIIEYYEKTCDSCGHINYAEEK